MNNLGLRSLCLAFSLTCVAAPLLTACSSSGDSHERVGESGSISLALTTAGPDGATYGFPLDAYLVIQSSTFSEYIQLNGDAPALEKTLAVGTYTASLYFGGGNVVLTKTDASGSSTVPATWTNPQPLSFDIVKGQTTPVALHFSVKGLADVTFDTGLLHITTDVVTDDSGPIASGALNGTANAYYLQNTDDAAPYATALHVDQGVDYGVSFEYHAMTAWQPGSSNSVCQTGTLTQSDATGSSGLGQRMAELRGANVSLCVYDYGATDQLSISASQMAAPPAGQEAFLPDPSYYYVLGLNVPLGDVYDSTTLHQSALANISFTDGFFYHFLYTSSYESLSTAQGNLSGTLTLTP